MNKQNENIALYYQLTGEYLLFYFLLHPILHAANISLSYWGYLSVIMLALMLHVIAKRWLNNFNLYALVFLVLLGTLLFGYQISFFISLLLTIFFIWRQIVHGEEPDLQHQKKLIMLMLFLFLFNIFWMFEEKLIWIVVIFFAVMISGYMMSHVTLGKDKSSQLTVILFVIASMMTGGAFLYLFYDFVRLAASFIWSGVSQILMIFVKGIALIVEVSPLEIEAIKEGIESKNTLGLKLDISDEMPKPRSDSDPASAMAETSFSWWIPAVAVVGLLVLLFFIMKKKNMTSSLDNIEESTPVYTRLEEKKEEGRRISPMYKRNKSNQRENDAIRMRVFELEELAQEKGYGRYEYETIEEWLERLEQKPSHLDIYQDVRYGNKKPTEEEADLFMKEIESIKAWMNRPSEE